QLQRDAVAPMVEDALAAHGIGGERLMLELTENCFIADPARAATILGALKALRCRIAMDDFGTGYSSLSYMKRFPIDTLKIDKSFVRDMTTDPDDASIV
ncbi:MAG: EAL domain-containing protein, partial [Nostoc sp.]